MADGRLWHTLGFAGKPPGGRAFQRALDEALGRMQEFLLLRAAAGSSTTQAARIVPGAPRGRGAARSRRVT
jgi:hypothetical protein